MEWKLFADLADHVDEEPVHVEARDAGTVGEALAALLEDHSALEERVLDEDGDLKPQINVLRNGRNVQTQEEGLETPVAEGDELALFPPVSGG